MVRTYRFRVETRGHTDVVDITDEIECAVAESGDGVATVFVPGSTAGLTTIENEPGLVRDLQDAFEKIAPEGADYYHHDRWNDNNGSSHIRAALVGPSLSVPFSGGKLLLGTWQQVVLVDFDTRARNREVTVQVISG